MSVDEGHKRCEGSYCDKHPPTQHDVLESLRDECPRDTIIIVIVITSVLMWNWRVEQGTVEIKECKIVSIKMYMYTQQ